MSFIFARNSGANVYARVLANPESIRKTLSSSIQKTNFAVLNPSVSSNGKIEKALVRKWNIAGVICRQSGGSNEILWHRICLSMKINLWLLERPTEFKNINSETISLESALKKEKVISLIKELQNNHPKKGITWLRREASKVLTAFSNSFLTICCMLVSSESFNGSLNFLLSLKYLSK